MHLNLLSLAPGQHAGVEGLEFDGGMRRKLLDLGFTPGAQVTCLFSAPSGDPRAYLVRDTVVALRRSDARHILCLGEVTSHGA